MYGISRRTKVDGVKYMMQSCVSGRPKRCLLGRC